MHLSPHALLLLLLTHSHSHTCNTAQLLEAFCSIADLADGGDTDAVRAAVRELDDSGALHEYAATARDDAPCAQALAHLARVRQHATL